MSVPAPGPGRITLALLFVVPAVMAYPWHSVSGRWAVAVAVAMLLALFAGWRGMHLTTILRRGLALAFRGRRGGGTHQLVDYASTDARTTVALRLIDGGGSDLPLDVVAGYLDRYGLSCDWLRVTSRDTDMGRMTWIGLTMSAATNLAALQARSATLPLRETAEITLRRLADHLRELGWALTISDIDIPDLLGPEAKERWCAVADGAKGCVAAYSIAAESFADTLTELWSMPFAEVWTAIELSAGGVAAACAIRTADLSRAAPKVAGLTLCRGRQREALAALEPMSTKPLVAEQVPINLSGLTWRTVGAPVRT